MSGIVLQVNVSQGGIPKLPIPEGRVTRRGIEGDRCAHPNIHGGPKQALLLIAAEDLEALQQLGYPVYPGALGENLTVRGVPFRDVRIGDRFHAGEATLEVTKLRQPCRTLDGLGKGIQKHLYDKIPGHALWGRGGFYTRVLTEGLIRPGDIIAKADLVV